MPSRSGESRKNEVMNLTSIAHSMLKSNKVTELLKQAFVEKRELNVWQLANLQEIETKVLQVSCIEDNLQRNFVSSTTQCELIWREARRDNDYARFKPHLQTVLDCVKEIANIKSVKFNCSEYDALLSAYEPNRKTTEVREAYAIIKKEISDLIPRIVDKQKGETVIPLTEKIGIEQQKLIAKKIMQIMEFDFTKGRLDESAHPFCRGTPHDIRLTTRYNENNFLSGIMAAIHETGHGLYEQNLPLLYKDQPVGKAKNMAVHESQSLLMEMQIGKSKEFMEFLSKLLRDEFAFKGLEYSSDNLYKLITRVNPGFIRVGSDELTYPMHVILRFEIEEALINGDLTLDELPIYWSQKMYEYLGIRPTSDREGCLQDIHWSLGDFGYFPSYTNGAIIASMIIKKNKEDKH